MENKKRSIFIKSTSSLQQLQQFSITTPTSLTENNGFFTEKLKQIDNFILDNWATKSKVYSNCKKEKGNRKIFQMIEESNKENQEEIKDLSFPEAKFDEKNDEKFDKNEEYVFEISRNKPNTQSSRNNMKKILIENKNLQDENFKLIGEINRKREETLDFEKKIKESGEKILELSGMLENLKKENVGLKEDIIKCKEINCTIKEEKVATLEQNYKLSKKLEEYAPTREKYDQLKKEINRILKENEKLKAEKSKTMEKFNEMNKKMMILIQQNEKLTLLVQKSKTTTEFKNSFQVNESFLEEKKSTTSNHNFSNPMKNLQENFENSINLSKESFINNNINNNNTIINNNSNNNNNFNYNNNNLNSNKIIVSNVSKEKNEKVSFEKKDENNEKNYEYAYNQPKTFVFENNKYDGNNYTNYSNFTYTVPTQLYNENADYRK